jgi:hypothetical protein
MSVKAPRTAGSAVERSHRRQRMTADGVIENSFKEVPLSARSARSTHRYGAP